MESPQDRVYSESHEWHKLDGSVVTIGLTQFAVDQLTDVTYVEMKPAGTRLGPNEIVGEVESVKTTSDVYSVAGGEIIEVNSTLEEDPGIVNNEPYEGGWLVKVRLDDPADLDGCMDASAYDGKYAQ